MPTIEEIEARNRALVQRTYHEILMNPNVDDAIRVYDEMFDENYSDHMLFDYPVMAPTKAALREQIRMMLTAFSDMQAEMLHLYADHNKVAHYARFTARHTGNFIGIPPTNKEVTWTEVHMSIVTDEGKFVEHWGHIDIDAVMRQLDVNPADLMPPQG